MSEDCCSQPSAGSAACELSSPTFQRKSQPGPACPACNQKGKAVQGQTVKALLSVSLRLIQDAQYYFCRTPSCPVVYYSLDGKSTFSTAQLRERVYQKEPGAEDVFVCYCFKHTVGEIHQSSPEACASILDEIETGIRADRCACDLRNPQGSCCLGNVRQLMSNKTPWTSRPYQTVEDLRQMQDLLMEARALTSDWRYWHVGELLWNYFMVDCHLKPQEYIRLWHDGQGKLIGYAMLGEDPSFDWQVHPEYEWRGIEAEAMDWLEARLGELRQLDAQQWGSKIVSGSRQDNPQRIAFLEQHGFQPGGEFSEVNMLRSLDIPIPEAALPPGCQVRPFAGLSEITNRAGAEREVWFPWTVGNVTDEDYARLMQFPGYDPQLDIVAIAPDGVIAAYVNCWIDPLNRIGDFGPVGARPAYRRQGLTRAVLLEGLRRFRERGMQRACVSTGLANTPARRLYESIGFEAVNEYWEYVR